MESHIKVGDLNRCVGCGQFRETAIFDDDRLPLCEDCTPNDDILKCIEGVVKLIEESLPIVYYATSEEIEDDHVYGFKNPEWYLLSPGDFEKAKKEARGHVRLVHVRDMPIEAWPPPTFMAEHLLDAPSFPLGRAWGLNI